MAHYNIPITFQSYTIFNIEADSLQEATEKAVKTFLSIPDENYLDDSYEVDETSLQENYPTESVDVNKIKYNL
jgi:hypothetical protein